MQKLTPFTILESAPSDPEKAVMPGHEGSFPSKYLRIYTKIPQRGDSLSTRVRAVRAIRSATITGDLDAVFKNYFKDKTKDEKENKSEPIGLGSATVRRGVILNEYCAAMSALFNACSIRERNDLKEVKLDDKPELVFVICDFIYAHAAIMKSSIDRRRAGFCGITTPMVLKRETGSGFKFKMQPDGTRGVIFRRAQAIMDPDFTPATKRWSVDSKAPALGAFQMHPMLMATNLKRSFTTPEAAESFVRSTGAFFGSTNFGLQYMHTQIRNDRMALNTSYWQPRTFQRDVDLSYFESVPVKQLQQAKYMFGYPNLLSSPLGYKPSNWRSSILDKMVSGVRLIPNLKDVDFIRGLDVASHDDLERACNVEQAHGFIAASIFSYASVSDVALKTKDSLLYSQLNSVFKGGEKRLAAVIAAALRTLVLSAGRSRELRTRLGTPASTGLFIDIKDFSND